MSISRWLFGHSPATLGARDARRGTLHREGWLEILSYAVPAQVQVVASPIFEASAETVPVTRAAAASGHARPLPQPFALATSTNVVSINRAAESLAADRIAVPPFAALAIANAETESEAIRRTLARQLSGLQETLNRLDQLIGARASETLTHRAKLAAAGWPRHVQKVSLWISLPVCLLVLAAEFSLSDAAFVFLGTQETLQHFVAAGFAAAVCWAAILLGGTGRIANLAHREALAAAALAVFVVVCFGFSGLLREAMMAEEGIASDNAAAFFVALQSLFFGVTASMAFDRANPSRSLGDAWIGYRKAERAMNRLWRRRVRVASRFNRCVKCAHAEIERLRRRALQEAIEYFYGAQSAAISDKTVVLPGRPPDLSAFPFDLGLPLPVDEQPRAIRALIDGAAPPAGASASLSTSSGEAV